MKKLEVKSMIVGIVFTSIVFFSVAATRPTDDWDTKQKWEVDIVTTITVYQSDGWEPFSSAGHDGNKVMIRRRVR